MLYGMTFVSAICASSIQFLAYTYPSISLTLLGGSAEVKTWRLSGQILDLVSRP